MQDHNDDQDLFLINKKFALPPSESKHGWLECAVVLVTLGNAEMPIGFTIYLMIQAFSMNPVFGSSTAGARPPMFFNSIQALTGTVGNLGNKSPTRA